MLSGRAGTVKLELPQLDPVGLAAFKLVGADAQSAQAAGERGLGCRQTSRCRGAECSEGLVGVGSAVFKLASGANTLSA